VVGGGGDSCGLSMAIACCMLVSVRDVPLRKFTFLSPLYSVRHRRRGLGLAEQAGCDGSGVDERREQCTSLSSHVEEDG
jgi:hypothetical protein